MTVYIPVFGNALYSLLIKDFAICIAVIHHFSSHERRLEACNELLRIVIPGGKVLIFVWAFEQTVFEFNVRRFLKSRI